MTCILRDVHHDKLASELALLLPVASRCNCVFLTFNLSWTGPGKTNFYGINEVQQMDLGERVHSLKAK